MQFPKVSKFTLKIKQHRWSTVPYNMTVKLVLFFSIEDDLPPWQKKGGIVGTMGPGSVPLASRPSPRAPKGLGPKANRPRNARPILRLGTPKGLGLKASRPWNARSILQPGARVPHIPDALLPRCLLSRSATPPNEAANRLFML